MIRFMDLDFIDLHRAGSAGPGRTSRSGRNPGRWQMNPLPQSSAREDPSPQPEIDRRIGLFHPLQIFVDIFFIGSRSVNARAIMRTSA